MVMEFSTAYEKAVPLILQGTSANPIDLTSPDGAGSALDSSDLTDLSCMLSPRDSHAGLLPTATPEVLPLQTGN
jgi:hypothetical protein